jgi:large subunit ribosomal protein L5
MARLMDRYQKEITKQLAKDLGRTNPHSLPKLQKIVVNMGVGKALQDKNRIDQAAEQLAQITGQKAQITLAKVAVSGFRLRENNAIGCRVTLRGRRMYEFLDRLISVALPRIRDFRGVNPKSFDGHGNYSMGLSEQGVFPEIDPDKVTFVQGMDVTFVTNTDNDDEARRLLRAFGMPFREE